MRMLMLFVGTPVMIAMVLWSAVTGNRRDETWYVIDAWLDDLYQ